MAAEIRSETRASHRGAYVALAVMVVIWAVNFSIAKFALQTLTPAAVNALRFPFAALVVYIALRVRGPIPMPSRRDLPRVLALGLGGNVIYQQFFIYGLEYTRAGTASVLLAGTPIMTATLSHVVGHERVSRRVWLGAVATFAGIAVVVMSGSAEVGFRGIALGELLLVGASLAWSLYTVGSRPLIARYGSVAVTAWTLWAGTVGLFLIGLPAVLRTELATVSITVWLAVLYAGALSIGVAYLIWYDAVRQIGNARTGVFGNLVPVVALPVAWLLLGEVPVAGQIAGAVIIIAGVTMAQRRPGPRGPARP